MPQYVIEREMPGAGSLSPEDLKLASQTSCSVLRDLGPQIQWVHSYVTDNKIYCIYRAPNEDMPVVFFVDPKIKQDPDTRDIDEITLSYTFYPVETGTAAR